MKKWIIRIGVILVGFILISIGAVYVWFQYSVRQSLPQISGQVPVSGIKEDVEIIRDNYGVPHIYAQNEPDLYFALGYAMAQDRFWQMEFQRRLGHGRLAEIFGEKLLETDRYFRLMTAAGVNQPFSDEFAFVTNSFANGVNAYLETHSDRLPIEFKILRYTPEPWSSDDFLAISKVINWGLSLGWRVDITAGKILDKVGEAKFKEAFPSWPADSPLIVPEGIQVSATLTDAILKLLSRIEKQVNLPAPAASNNWVVSGSKSASGKPILANDPHLMLTNPSVWWEAHMVCPTIDVSGFAIAGAPGIPLGHNRRVAWGVTNVMVDDVDFFIEKINPDNPHQYLYKGRWEDMRVIKETIRIKDKDPVHIDIKLTRHGPILKEDKAGSEPTAIAVKWAFADGLQSAKAFYLLAKATDTNNVVEALKYWELPSQNFVFADTGGNIGYWCCATIPIRSRGDGLLPVPGWSGDYEWQGYVPFENRPQLINPAQGYIATANNKVAAENYPHFISHYWEPSDRIRRIHQLLNTPGKLSVEDVKQMQQDIFSELASELTPEIVRVLAKESEDPDLQKARQILAEWNFKMEQDSVAACLFEMTFMHMLQNIFKDELGPELFQQYLKTSVFPPRAMRALIRNGSSAWFDDVNTADTETKQDIIARSVKQTIGQLKDEFGDNPSRWRWGDKHTLTFEHPLGKIKPLDRLFNIGPFSVGGSRQTVNMKLYSYEKPYNAILGASYRMIVDFSNMSVAHHVLPTGQSGQLGSPHYKDQIDLYLNGQYRTAWLERSDIEKHARGTLFLRPKK
ncbi:MAG: penicillin acylase family protein [Desulfobacterales bacterium]|jgi:penicillin amidase